MKKSFALMIIVFATINIINAQTIEKKWGFGGGAGTYYNLETGKFGFAPNAYLSRYVTKSFDLMANVTLGYFGNQDVNEPLDMLSPSLNLRYKLYNGYIMPIQSKLQPYLYGGVGYMFDNAQQGLNFNAGAGIKYPLNPTFSLFAEAGYINGIPSERLNYDGVMENIQDNFIKVVAGFEISFIKQKDSDKDGVIDILDECPDTPKGATVDKVGCPSDTDGDGVYDGIDECPLTPKGVQVDEKGCPIDSDGDGVADYIDQCPDTPKKVKVDDKGCPFDEDGDGVYDDDDKCPGTPAGTLVDKKGCPVDSDGDGVTDDKDQCPDTPKGVEVDERGCELDDDGDGVPNSKDKCPNTIKGAKVDNDGCVDHKANIDFINNNLKPVYYATNVSAVTPEQAVKIDNLVKILNDYPEYNINVYGHADPRGSAEYNLALSQRRVNSVVAMLKARGVAASRIRTKAFGEELAPEGELTEAQLQELRKTASYMFITIDE
jgi:outer membrane protein OmpA-like peptidoglycan-associated protein